MDHITLHLQALQKLYGLLKTHGTSSTPADILDDNARRVLKHLLDAATSEVLSSKAQLIPGRLGTLLPVTPTQAAPVEQPIQNMVSGLVPGYGLKRCLVCQRSTVKQLEFVEDTNSEVVAQDSVSDVNCQRQGNDGTDSFLWNSDRKPGSVVVEKTRQSVDNGRHTGSPISDMKDLGYTEFPLSRMVDCNQYDGVGCLSDEASEEIKKIESCISALQHAHHDELKPGQNVNLNRGPNVKSIIERIESRKWMLNNDNLMPRRDTPTFNSANDGSLNEMKKKSSGNARFPANKPSNGLVNMSTKQNVETVNASHHVSPTRRGAHRNWYPSTSRGVAVLNKKRRYGTTSLKQKSKSGTSSSPYSSGRTSHGNNTYSSDSEEYSSPVRTRGVRDTANSSASNTSWTTTLSSKSAGKYGSYAGHNDNDMNSSSGYEAHQFNSDSGSKTEFSSSSYNQSMHRPMQSRLRRPCPSKTGKQANGFNHTKGGGTLKKLKDRLAIIFHQHHHHYHHHGKEDNHKKGKSFSSKEVETHEKKAVEKLRKSDVHGKKHKSPLGGLMRAVLSHVRRSKKLKPEETGAPRSKGYRGNKKNMKKSQRANFTKKAHIKLGVGKQKARLKALPKIK